MGNGEERVEGRERELETVDEGVREGGLVYTYKGDRLRT